MEDVHIYIIIGVAVAVVVIGITVFVSYCLWKRKVCKNDAESQATNKSNQESHHELHSNAAFQTSSLELQSNTAGPTSTPEHNSNRRILQAIDTYNVVNENQKIHSVRHVTKVINAQTISSQREIIRLKEAEQRRQQQDQENLDRLQQENDLQVVRIFEQRQQQYPQQRGRQRNRKRNQGKRQQSQSNSRSRTDFPEKTTDLHNLSVRDAMQQFMTFVRQMEEIYLDNNFSRKDRFFYVITGRGKHSQGGIPKIKPAVQGYLDKHDYVHEWKNQGMVMIDLLSKRDLLSEDLCVL